ncbi:hypothetical protein COO60DRAFT_1551700 [Scenedesmus sp. NREL 46B-D3]|nr:hypothetical protein COO60DRAFT_1551700 [Scenedesmus sp. NREL 46B-D3]
MAACMLTHNHAMPHMTTAAAPSHISAHFYPCTSGLARSPCCSVAEHLAALAALEKPPHVPAAGCLLLLLLLTLHRASATCCCCLPCRAHGCERNSCFLVIAQVIICILISLVVQGQ